MQNSIKTCGNLCTELGPPVDRGQGRKLQVITHFRHHSFFNKVGRGHGGWDLKRAHDKKMALDGGSDEMHGV